MLCLPHCDNTSHRTASFASYRIASSERHETFQGIASHRIAAMTHRIASHRGNKSVALHRIAGATPLHQSCSIVFRISSPRCTKCPSLSNFVTFGTPGASAFMWVAFLFTGKFPANLGVVEKHNILLLRRKTCALLRAKTSALLRRKTRAVLRARTCALFRANTKEAAFGCLHKGWRPSAAPFVVSFVLALNRAHVLALNTAHDLRLDKADVFTDLRPNNKI